jgi:predicted membrane GTPase involved in stress response
MLNETREGERRETIAELSDLFLVVQEMGRRLADETHGDLYAQVRELNELLHQARIQITRIKDGTVDKG